LGYGGNILGVSRHLLKNQIFYIMKKYVFQLIADITKAHLPALAERENLNLTFEQEMEIIENYATGTNTPPSLSVECGITTDQFPPQDQLDEEEIKQIIDALKSMLLSRNICVDMPDEIPLHFAYPIFVNLLNREAWYFPTGNLHIDFCTGYAPECELGKYCHCLKYWEGGKEEI